MQIILEKKVLWNYFLITGDLYLKKNIIINFFFWLKSEGSPVYCKKRGIKFVFDQYMYLEALYKRH